MLLTDEAPTGKKAPLEPADYLNKPATALHDRFGIWIKEEVGYNPSTAKTKDEAFLAGVRIATATRMVFQASDFNRAETAKLRAEREAAVAAAPVTEPKAAPAPKPAKTAKPKASAAVPAAPAAEAPKPARRPARRAPAAAATVSTDEAPF